jgi:hypothetical protein
MRRREFVQSLFSGAAVGAPFFAGGESPPMPSGSAQESAEALTVRCEHLLLQVQEANRRLAEAERDLSQVYYTVHLLNNHLGFIRLVEDHAWKNADGELSDEDRRDLDVGWERVCGLLRAVFDRDKAGRKRVSADVIS